MVSGTLEEPLGWNNSALIGGGGRNLVEEISNLKRRPGEIITVLGSGDLVRFLLRYGLLEELGLMVYPIILGYGKRLFEDGGKWYGLKLVNSRTFASGVVSLIYFPAGQG